MASGVVVGLMSGTSLDGISAAVARFRDASGGRVDVDLLGYSSRPYTSAERNRLSAALGGGTPAEYCRLVSISAAGWLTPHPGMAEAGGAGDCSYRSTGRRSGTSPATPPGKRAGCRHRRTNRRRCHQPFPVRDVAAGGRGLPGPDRRRDALLLRLGWRGLQNLGGIGNITIVPPHGQIGGVRAFTGPGVAVIVAR
jgi:anhydro-N-acetylmuramic acid kinase